MSRLEPEFANESHLPTALGVDSRLLMVKGVGLLFLISLNHTVFAVRQVSRGVARHRRMAQRAARSSGHMVTNPPASSTIHACNITTEENRARRADISDLACLAYSLISQPEFQK